MFEMGQTVSLSRQLVPSSAAASSPISRCSLSRRTLTPQPSSAGRAVPADWIERWNEAGALEKENLMRMILALSVASLLAAPALAADGATQTPMTRDTGAPVGDNQNSKLAGPEGPVRFSRTSTLSRSSPVSIVSVFRNASFTRAAPAPRASLSPAPISPSTPTPRSFGAAGRKRPCSCGSRPSRTSAARPRRRAIRAALP